MNYEHAVADQIPGDPRLRRPQSFQEGEQRRPKLAYRHHAASRQQTESEWQPLSCYMIVCQTSLQRWMTTETKIDV